MLIYTFLAVGSLLCYVLYQWFHSTLRHIPGPRGWPLLGNVREIDMAASYVKISAWAKQYGPVFKFSLFTQEVVVITGTEALLEVMVKRGEDFAGRAKSYRAAYLTDNYQNISLSSYSKTVKWLRKFAHKQLHLYGTGLKNIENITIEELQDMIGKLTEMIDVPVNPIPIVHDVTLAIMYIIVFGTKIDKDSTEFKMLQLADEKANEAMGVAGSGALLDMFPWLRYCGNSVFHTLAKAKDIYTKLYEDSKAKFNKSDGSLQGIALKLFEELAQKDKSLSIPKEFGPKHIQHVLMDLLFAGSLTTTSSFGSLFNILVHNDHMQGRLHEEVDRVVGSGRYVGLQDQLQMPYTWATVLELVRCVDLFH